jgi:single-strand DNA-binding protein
MGSLNKSSLIGHLGRDPDMRTLPDGTAVASLSLATTDKWKDRDTGELKDKTEWHRVVLYAGLAEACGSIQKGSQVYVEGPLRTRSWTDDAGVERYTTEIVGRNLQFLGRPPGGKPAEPPAVRAGSAPDLDNDIPF